MRKSLSGIVLSSLACLTAHAAVSVSDPSILWTPMNENFDYLNDHQTGSAAADIVGIGKDYGMMVTFNNNGAASATDGTLGFRLRLDAAGGNAKKAAFDRVAWIGIDADLDGAIDAFLGLNRQGNAEEILISAPGKGSNRSPKNTSIIPDPFRVYALTAENYDYRPVDYVTDGGTTNDLTTSTKGDPDYYVSFMVPFADVVSFLSAKSIAINDQTPLRYTSATSTQINKLNQDLGGVNGGVNSDGTWAELGGFTSVMTTGISPIPEPSSAFLAVCPLVAGLMFRRRKSGADAQ